MGQIYDQLKHWQLDTDAWLAQHQLTVDQIYNFDTRINQEIFESLILSAIKLSNQKALGLYVGQRLAVTSHGMLGYAMINSGCLREAISIFKEFINTRSPLISISIEEKNKKLQISFTENFGFNSIKPTFYEALMLAFINILLQISFGEIKIINIEFDYHEPDYQHLYEDFFSEPIKFSCKITRLTLSTQGLDDRLKMSDPTSLQQARKLCEKELARMGKLETFSQKIKEYMLLSIGHFPSLQKTADRFHMSPRTLHRHLLKDGTSFKEIVESVSHHLATEYLTESSLSIQEIAYLLGYMDSANFRRAFKRWEGCPPREYRDLYKD
jgi:AraC-like DNA-binding protein